METIHSRDDDTIVYKAFVDNKLSEITHHKLYSRLSLNIQRLKACIIAKECDYTDIKSMKIDDNSLGKELLDIFITREVN